MSPADTQVVAAPARTRTAARPTRARDVLARIGPGIAIGIPLVLGGLLLSPYGQFLGTTAMVMAIIALSLGVVTGRTGMISLCQFGFAGLGAWTMLWFTSHASGVPFLLAILLSGVAMLPISLLLSLPALRLRGVNLAVITLAFALAVQIVISVNEFPGESEGVFVTRPDWLATDGAFLWACIAIFVVLAIILALLDRTRVGAGWRAVRHSERATAALGRSVAQIKLSSFALSAFIAGIAGALLVSQLGTVEVDTFVPLTSLTAFAVAIMVASQYPEGALIAGALAVFIPELFTSWDIPQDYTNLLFAVGAIIGLKGGLGAAEAIRDGLRKLLRLDRPASPPAENVVEPPASAPAVISEPAPRPLVPASGNGASAPAALEVSELGVSYGRVRALDDVSLRVEHGTVTALIGPNGAGKSTLVDCVSGFVRHYTGEIRVDGIVVDGLVAHKRSRAGIRRSFQQDRTIPDLTVQQYIRLSVAHHHGDKRMGQEEIQELLEFFDAPAPGEVLARVDVATRRLVEAAAAVAAHPTVVLLDEPAAGLPAAESARLAQRIAEIPSRFGPAVLLIEHDMELVSAAASHAVVLDFGKVIASGSPAEVLADDVVVKAYLGEEVAV